MGSFAAGPAVRRTGPVEERPEPQRIAAHVPRRPLPLPTTQSLTAKYTLGKELGRGQFGITFECTDKSTGEKLACKAISKQKLKCDLASRPRQRYCGLDGIGPMP